MTKHEQIAQWVIEKRYPKNENETKKIIMIYCSRLTKL